MCSTQVNKDFLLDLVEKYQKIGSISTSDLIESVDHDQEKIFQFFLMLCEATWGVSIQDPPQELSLSMIKYQKLFYRGENYNFFFEPVPYGVDDNRINLLEMIEHKTNQEYPSGLVINAKSARDWLRIISACGWQILCFHENDLKEDIKIFIEIN